MDILVVIDMQNDFIDGSLGTQEAQEIVKNVVNKIGKYEFSIDNCPEGEYTPFKQQNIHNA